MRCAEVRTELDDAELVAAALVPDNTAQMNTRVEGDAIVTTIERETTGGLRSTVDDYVVNLDVARRTVDAATASGNAQARVPERNEQHADEQPTDRHDTDTHGDTHNP